VVEKCKLKSTKYKKLWLVQLVMGRKIKVTNWVKAYLVSFNGNKTTINLNTSHLGSYDMLIGMDRLEGHQEVDGCLNKSVTYTTKNGQVHIIKGIPMPISIL